MAANAFHPSPAIPLLTILIIYDKVVVDGKASSRTAILNRTSSHNVLNTFMPDPMTLLLCLHLQPASMSLPHLLQIVLSSVILEFQNVPPLKILATITCTS